MEEQVKEGSEWALTRNRVAINVIALSLGFAVFPSLAMSYFFKDTLKLDLAQMTFYNSILNFIWVMKPLFGFITDSYPICGSYKKSYLIIFSVVGSVSWILLGTWVTTLGQAMLIKTLINVSSSFCNVIGEGIMVQTSQVRTKSDPQRVSQADNDDGEDGAAAEE